FITSVCTIKLSFPRGRIDLHNAYDIIIALEMIKNILIIKNVINKKGRNNGSITFN
ncbi:hypothetical protein AAUPMC_10523, partial [Pasteurella multocida subsp. multocida str. Anand1_cattle]